MTGSERRAAGEPGATGRDSGGGDDLWMRIAALAKKEKISYLKATERCTEGFWDDHDLDKSP